jgi:hypothetical protein
MIAQGGHAGLERADVRAASGPRPADGQRAAVVRVERDELVLRALPPAPAARANGSDQATSAMA